MVKILSQGGRSLADMYQVVGSIAGVDELISREVTLVHDMHSTLFSERFRTTIRRVATGDQPQNTNFVAEINNMPAGVTRLLGVQIVSEDASRLSFCSVNVFDPNDTPLGQGFPIWIWSGTSKSVRLVHDGALTTLDGLIGEPGTIYLPSFTGGSGQHSASYVEDIRFRGRTTGFGAGTVDTDLLLYIAFTFTGGINAFGAQVPSW